MFTVLLFSLHACMHLSHFSHVWLFETSWPVAHQAPLNMGFTRPLWTWDSPGRNTGSESGSCSVCVRLCDPHKDHTVHGIVQVRILEWLPFPPPGESSWPNPSSVFLIKPKFPAVPALQADYLLLRPQGSPSVQLTSQFSPGLPRDAEAWSLPINTWVLTNRLPLQVKTQTDHNRVKPQTRLTG